MWWMWLCVCVQNSNLRWLVVCWWAFCGRTLKKWVGDVAGWTTRVSFNICSNIQSNNASGNRLTVTSPKASYKPVCKDKLVWYFLLLHNIMLRNKRQLWAQDASSSLIAVCKLGGGGMLPDDLHTFFLFLAIKICPSVRLYHDSIEQRGRQWKHKDGVPQDLDRGEMVQEFEGKLVIWSNND